MSGTHETILSRWHVSLENTVCSSLEFYEAVADFLEQKQLPDISLTHITRREGGWFSYYHRIYLRVRWNRLFFDVAAFPVGSTLVLSWWLHSDAPSIIDLFAEIPVLGYFLERTVLTGTYYSVDLVEHFQRMVHASVLQAVDTLMDEGGLERIPNEVRQPILTEFFR